MALQLFEVEVLIDVEASSEDEARQVVGDALLNEFGEQATILSVRIGGDSQVTDTGRST